MTPEHRELQTIERLDADPRLRLELQRSIYRESLLDFVKAAWPIIDPAAFKPNWHIDAICEHLQAQSQGQLQNLIINVPPGSAKSLIAGVFWPCWEWTHSPGIQTLATSAAESLAKRDNLRARRLLTSPWYQKLFPLELEQDSNNALKFTNDRMGHREASTMSSLTGKRANRVIVDDAISASNASSDALRDNVNETYWLNAPSRVNDPLKDTTTIIQQRLHEDDLVGSILSKEGDHWEKLVIPMEYYAPTFKSSIGWQDPRKKNGELLFPSHWDASYLKRIRAQDAYKFASQYQQDPVPDRDGFFERQWFNRFDPKNLPKNLHLYMSSDHSVGGTTKSDYSVFRIWGLDEFKNLWLVASHRTQDRLTKALGITTDDKGQLGIGTTGALALVRRYKPLAWFAEPDNNFKSTRAMLDDTMRAANIYCRIIYADSHHHTKAEKAQPMAGMANLGKIYLPSDAIGDAALAEYVKFGVSGHDDQVDADAIIPRMLRNAHAALVPPTPNKRNRDGYEFTDDEGDKAENWNTFF